MRWTACVVGCVAAAVQRGHVGRLILIVAVGLLTAGPAAAAPYWVAWEGNDYPENEGWTRIVYGEGVPAAERSLSGGVMTLDGLADIQTLDTYRMERNLDPEAGEEFFAQWRMRVDDTPSFIPHDPGFAITSDDGWHVSLAMSVDEVYSFLEQSYTPFAPGDYVEWEFRSADMRTYTLAANGTTIDTGSFVEIGVLESRIYWGDFVSGAASKSEWDYFQFGIVPEPPPLLAAASGLSFLAVLRTRRMS